MAPPASPPFGDLLRRYRAVSGMTQEELAEQAGLSVEAISALERGTRHSPRKETVQLLAEALALSERDQAILLAARRRGVTQTLPPAGQAIASATLSDAPLPVGGFLGALPEGPLVAREAERAALMTALGAVANRMGRVVLLSGEPGAGKTRLAQEVTLEAHNRNFLVASGRCYEPHESVPFYPFLEALASTYAAAPVALRAEVAQHWPDVLRLLPDRGAALASVAPTEAELGGNEEQQRLFWAVTGFVRALADLRPIALLFDDLQWADGSSLALLQHLARQTRACRVLLLGTYRDDEVRRQHPLEALLRDLGREHLLQRLEVKRLPPAGTAALAATLMGTDEPPTELAELVHQGTEGNPYFTIEVVRALIERGDVYEQEGRWQQRAGIEIAVPESVRSAIAQRLARFSPLAQEVLQDACVLGQSFTFEDVQAMRDRPEVEVEAALEVARAAGLIREAGGDTYAFQHGLIQQALYAELSGRRRQRAHRVAGDVLERLSPRERERRAAELAWHFVAGGVPERALPYALRAGDQAEAVFAHHEAEQRYKQARDLARDLGERGVEAAALFRLGALYMTVARYDEALEALERAAEAYRANGDREGRRRAIALVGRVHARRGAPAQGIQRLEPLLRTATGTELSDGLAALHIALADLYYTSGRYREQLAAAERAASLARAAGDEALLAQAEQWRSTALLALGRADEALPVLQEVIPKAEAAGDLSSHTHALNHVALAYIQQGQFETGRAYIERALALAERRGDPAQIAFMAYNRGMIAVYTGEWRQARADYERAAAVMSRVGMSWTAAYPLLGLGHLSLLEGHWEEASRGLQKAITLAERSGDLQALRYAQTPLIERDLLEGRPEVARARLDRLLDPRSSGRYEGVANLLTLTAWLRLELGEAAQADVLAAQAVTQAQTEQNQLALVEALRIQALAATRQRRFDAAREAIERALALSRTLPCPYHTARALFSSGAILKEQGEPEPARARLLEAQALLDGLGERLYAQQVEQLLAELGRS
jgi:predicted ATPase/transcriptional regulator with XRE-family HTH domain